MRITIELPLPPPQLHPNKRCHWKAKLKPKADARATAKLLTIDALNRSTFGGRPYWKMAEVESTWHLARRNDNDNLLAWGKNFWDGVADAGIIADDRGFVFLPPKQVLDPKRNGVRKLVLTITERK